MKTFNKSEGYKLYIANFPEFVEGEATVDLSPDYYWVDGCQEAHQMVFITKTEPRVILSKELQLNEPELEFEIYELINDSLEFEDVVIGVDDDIIAVIFID